MGVLAAICAHAIPARADDLRRYAVVAGNDRGGAGTRALLYAKDDARKVWDILTRLGSVRAEDAALLLDDDAARFLDALANMEARARIASARGERTALVVYYSGHSKDGALRLGESQLSLDALKARLARAPFDVRIGVFDSCRSGALTRTKGARKLPAFEIDVRSPREARGTVILTASTSDEDAQESDLLGGSYFSHHLASGLLDFLVDGKGFVSAEVVKADGIERRIALGPGVYRIKRRLPDRLRVGLVEIPRGQLVALVEPMLRDAPFSDDPVKGPAREPAAIARWSVGVGGGYQSVFAAPSAGLFPVARLVGLEVALRDFLRRDRVWGLDFAAGGTNAEVTLPSGR